MKELKVIFWALLSMGCMVLLASFLSTEENNYAQRYTPHYQALQRLGEMARIKYHHAQLHIAFANQAQEEKLDHIERLFRAIAYSEQVQCRQCQEAIKNLGGRFTKPVTIEIHSASTAENILRADSLKSEHRSKKSHGMIMRSMASDNAYVTRILVWCDANDSHQITLLRYNSHNPPQPKSIYHVCPKCGYLSEHAQPTPICPQCKSSATRFVRF